MNGLLSLSFASKFSSFQGTGGTKYRMTPLCKVNYHSFCNSVPIPSCFQCQFSCHFFCDPGPRNDQIHAGICEHNSQPQLNLSHTFLCFFILTTQCDCALTCSMMAMDVQEAATSKCAKTEDGTIANQLRKPCSLEVLSTWRMREGRTVTSGEVDPPARGLATPSSRRPCPQQVS